MSEHTPGPWVVFHDQRDHTNDILPAMREGCIAQSVSDANAWVIAAAPDLLAALTEFVERGDCSRAMLEQGRAALAKATGTGT